MWANSRPNDLKSRRSLGGGRSALGFAVLAGTQITLIATITVVLVAMPAIQAEFGLSEGQLALITSAYGLAFAGLLLFGGRVVDLLGDRRVFVVATTVFGLASAAAATAPNVVVLLIGRFAQGCSAAFVAPSAMSLLALLYPSPQRHRRALTIWGGLSAIGATTGTLLSGVVVTWASWRWLFVLPAVVAIAAAAAIRVLVASSAESRQVSLDWRGAVAATVGLSTISYGLLFGPESSWSPGSLVPIFVGVAALVAFAIVEQRTRTPLVALRSLTFRRLTGLLGIFTSAAVMASTFFVLALHLQLTAGLTPLWTTAVFVPFGVLQVGTGALAGSLIRRLGPTRVSALGLAVAASALLVLSHIDPGGSVGAVLVGLPVLAVGVALAFAASMPIAVEGTRRDQRGVAAALANTAMEVGPTLGLAVLVSLASARSGALRHAGASDIAASALGFQLAFLVAAAATTVVALITALSPRISPAALPEGEKYPSYAQKECP